MDLSKKNVNVIRLNDICLIKKEEIGLLLIYVLYLWSSLNNEDRCLITIFFKFISVKNSLMFNVFVKEMV